MVHNQPAMEHKIQWRIQGGGGGGFMHMYTVATMPLLNPMHMRIEAMKVLF